MDTHTSEIAQLTNDVGNLMASKVGVAQGIENAGKALVVGTDGNVIPGDVSGGEVWEEVDLVNFPSDWKLGDRFKCTFKVGISRGGASSWTSAPFNTELGTDFYESELIELVLQGRDTTIDPNTSTIIRLHTSTNYITVVSIYSSGSVDSFNNGSIGMNIYGASFNGAGLTFASMVINNSNRANVIGRMYRLKKS